MKEKIIIPKDIKKVINRWIIKDLLKLTGMLVLFVLLALTIGNTLMKEMSDKVKLTVFAIWMMVPFFIRGVPGKYYRKNYKGKITKVDIVETMKVPLVGVLRVTSCPEAPINNIKLHISSDDGENVLINAFSGRAMNSEFIDFFHSGDEVLCINGVNFVQRLPGKPDDPINCVVCGAVQEQDRQKCVICGHTLHFLLQNSNSENNDTEVSEEINNA